MADELTWEGVLAWRAERQGLAQRSPAAAWIGVVRRMCGLHAQIASCAELTLWARVDALGRDVVARALWDERQLVRIWAMRGTLHLLPADELEAVRGSFGTMPKLAALRGDVCFAKPAGQKVRFTRPDLWLGRWRPVAPPRAALAGVLSRYLAVYGPATHEEFARWFGMPSAAQAGRELRALGDEVVKVAVEGAAARWMLATDVAAPRGDSAVLAERHRARVYRSQGWLSPVLLVDGRIEGVWSHDHRRGRLSVEIERFGDPGEAVRAGAEAEAARLATYLGAADLAVSWA